jgi:hypothetical protein
MKWLAILIPVILLVAAVLLSCTKKGTREGHRVGLASANVCRVIVNSATTFAKDDFLLADTLRLLREIFAAMFLATSLELRDRERAEATGISAVQYLADFVAANSGGTLTSTQALREMESDFQSYVKTFAKSLAETHPEIVGEPAEKWTPVILSQAAINIGFYLHERFGERVPETMQITIVGTLSSECATLLSGNAR